MKTRLIHPEPAADECQHDWEPDDYGCRCYWCGEYYCYGGEPWLPEGDDWTGEEFKF
jgi:hypothetical protein